MAEVLSATRAARVSSRWQRRSSAPLAPRRSAGLDLNQEPCAYCGFAVPPIGCRYCPCSRRPALCDATCMARFWQQHKPFCDWHETRKLILDLLGVLSVSTLIMRYVGRMPRGPPGPGIIDNTATFLGYCKRMSWNAKNNARGTI